MLTKMNWSCLPSLNFEYCPTGRPGHIIFHQPMPFMSHVVTYVTYFISVPHLLRYRDLYLYPALPAKPMMVSHVATGNQCHQCLNSSNGDGNVKVGH